MLASLYAFSAGRARLAAELVRRL